MTLTETQAKAIMRDNDVRAVAIMVDDGKRYLVLEDLTDQATHHVEIGDVAVRIIDGYGLIEAAGSGDDPIGYYTPLGWYSECPPFWASDVYFEPDDDELSAAFKKYCETGHETYVMEG